MSVRYQRNSVKSILFQRGILYCTASRNTGMLGRMFVCRHQRVGHDTVYRTVHTRFSCILYLQFTAAWVPGSCGRADRSIDRLIEIFKSYDPILRPPYLIHHRPQSTAVTSNFYLEPGYIFRDNCKLWTTGTLSRSETSNLVGFF